MKKAIIIAISIAALALMGCATTKNSSLLGPGNYWSGDVAMTLVGQETSRVWLGFFGEMAHPPVHQVARNAGITRIATVEHFSQLGILGLWTDFTTKVTGE